MTKGVIVPLESARLIEYAVPIDCHICEGQNNFDAEYCRYCSAPMALAHQARNQKSDPCMIATIGASGAGKTVYLGMLMDVLSRHAKQMHLLARGAFSINLQQGTLSALAKCRFPEKTANEPDRWNWVHCQLRSPKHKHPLELIMPDMAGEAVSEEVNHPKSFRLIGDFLRKCSGAMVLIDATRLSEGTQEQEFFTMKLASYLGELESNAKINWAKKPVALILTKADQCTEPIDDPEQFAKTRAPGLWQQCRERFQNHRFFVSRVAGTCVTRETGDRGKVQIPLRIEPHGIVEPFEWLINKLRL